MANMYSGKILRVDLTTGEITTLPTERYTDRYLGGKAISIRVLCDEVGPGVDPLSPENLLCFDTGPFTGTAMPGSSRCNVSARSPVTGLLGLSSFGGFFAAELKFAGYDHLIVKGRSPTPVYLAIQNGHVSIREATSIWSNDTYETPKLLRKEMGDYDIKWACIGPAGENLVRYATIMSGTGDGAGRTGMGCVMGSKNLKAVAVRGTGSIQVARPEEYLRLCEWAMELVKNTEGYEAMSHLGDRRGLDSLMKGGNVLIDNATSTSDTFYDDDASQERLWREHGYQRAGCFNCPVRCMEGYRFPGVGDGVLSCELTLDMITHFGLKDLLSVYKLGLKEQRYGLDSHTLGNVMGWATHLYKQGLIGPSDTDGLDLDWGNGEVYLELTERIARRQGLGDILAENFDVAARRLGGDRWRELWKLAVQTKGMAHFNTNAKHFRGTALGMSVGPRGDYARGIPVPEMGPTEVSPDVGFTEQEANEQLQYSVKLSRRIAGTALGAFAMEYEGKAETIAYYEDSTGITDITLTCKWLSEWQNMPLTPDVQARVLSAGLGRRITADDLFEYQRRARNLERGYDCLMGATRADDTVPDRFFDEPTADGRFKGDSLDRVRFERMQDRYYEIRGWDIDTGIPTSDTIDTVGFADMAADPDPSCKAALACIRHGTQQADPS